MDIQEKANAYDEALERVRKVLNTPYTAHWDKHKELIEHIFPELAESKGEKISRKFKVGDIVQYITDSTDRRRIEGVDELCNMYLTNDSPIMFEIEDEWKLVVKNKELEEAADDYAVKVYNDFLKDKTTLDSKEGDEILIEAFRAGAEWQMKYNESTEVRSIS